MNHEEEAKRLLQRYAFLDQTTVGHYLARIVSKITLYEIKKAINDGVTIEDL